MNQASKADAFGNLFFEIDGLRDCIECYMFLYNGEKSDFESIKTFQSSFFFYFQRLLLNDIAIRLYRLLDPRKNDVLSLEYFTRSYVEISSQEKFIAELKGIRTFAKPILTFRHKSIAHNDLGIATGKNSSEPFNLSDTAKALEMTNSYLIKLRDITFPAWVTDPNERVDYIRSSHRKLAAKGIVAKAKRFNEELSYKNLL